jgi:hypothetical protein
MSNPGGEDRDNEGEQRAALRQEGEGRQEGSSTGKAPDHASGASREDDWGSSLPEELVREDRLARLQLAQKGSSTGKARDHASGAFPDMEWERWEQEDQAARLQLAQEGRRSASSDHQPGSEASSRVEPALSEWAKTGLAWAGQRLGQAVGLGDGGLKWHSLIRRDRRDRAPEKRTDRAPEKRTDRASGERERTATKAHEERPPGGSSKGKGPAEPRPKWDTVLQEARASAPQQFAEVAKSNNPPTQDFDEKERRIAAKKKERTEYHDGAGAKGKGRENGSDGNGGMSI